MSGNSLPLLPEFASQERAEIHKTIWRIDDALRGSLEGWEFKNYVLAVLFYRFLSEHSVPYLPQDFCKFGEMCALAHHSQDVATLLTETFHTLETSPALSEIFTEVDFTSVRLGTTTKKKNESLLKILDAVAGMRFGKLEASAVDTFGDAYELLMAMYATNSGKSGGEFFTPQEVSELLASLAMSGRESVRKVYDPACGSGSLLLKFAKNFGSDFQFFGQEINISSYNLCRMNMLLHGIDPDKFRIAHGDTLTEPAFQELAPFDAIVSNPPYSIEWNADPKLVKDPRFAPAGVLAPKTKADWAFVLHCLHYLAADGIAVIVVFPGILYRSGAEEKIRQYVVKNNFVDAVIQLPSNLFFGTTIATAILVLKKDRQDRNILFLDASQECVRENKFNKIDQPHRQKIRDAFVNRTNIDGFARLVSLDDLDASCSLSVSNCVTDEEEENIANINIQEVNAKILEISCKNLHRTLEIQKLAFEIDGKDDMDLVIEKVQSLRQELDDFVKDVN